MKKVLCHICTSFVFILCVISFSCFLGRVPAYAKSTPQKTLFIGNSFSFYNNLPEMYKKFVKEGKNIDIQCYACTFGGRMLREHVMAFDAVIRTKGDYTKLTTEEKKLFVERTRVEDVGEKFTFCPEIYKHYADLILGSDKAPTKKYSTIIIQPYYFFGNGDGNAEVTAQAVKKIMKYLGSSSTTFVFLGSHTYWKNLNYFVDSQNTVDKIWSKTVKNVQNDSTMKSYYKRFVFAKTGRAITNYLLYSGSTKAQKEEPAMYSSASKILTMQKVKNDVICGDSLHPTILGSYIFSATIYSAVYGSATSKTPSSKIWPKYRGGSRTVTYNIGTKNSKGGNFVAAYNNKNGISSPRICKMACFIADSTQWSGMNFMSSKDATAWKKNKNKPNYSYTPQKSVKVYFNSNGADKNEYCVSTYFYKSLYRKPVGKITRKSYTFMGWSLKASSQKIYLKPNSSFSNKWIKKHLGKTVKLYAVWKKK